MIGEFSLARAGLTGYQDGHARTVLGELVAKGILGSNMPKGSSV